MNHGFSVSISNVRPSPLDVCPRLCLGQTSRGSGLTLLIPAHLETMVYIDSYSTYRPEVGV